jgi:hypothetical protein
MLSAKCREAAKSARTTLPFRANRLSSNWYFLRALREMWNSNSGILTSSVELLILQHRPAGFITQLFDSPNLRDVQAWTFMLNHTRYAGFKHAIHLE